MTDRERIYFACLHPRFVGLLDELARDCLEPRVIDQVLGLADLSRGVASGLVQAIADYPAERWQGDERYAALDLSRSVEWWLRLIQDCESVPLPSACEEAFA